MVSTSTRASRAATRYSSPVQAGQEQQQHGVAKTGLVSEGGLEEGKANGGATQGSRALMARWLEPSVQSKASFEEAGLQRCGVLETMSALGTMPAKGKRAGVGVEGVGGGAPVRKIILRPSGSTGANGGEGVARRLASQEAASGSSDAAAGWACGSDSGTAAAVEKAGVDKKGRGDDVGEEEDYKGKEEANEMANELGRRRRSKRVSLPGNKTGVKREASPKRTGSIQEREFVDRVVEVAVDEALQHQRYPTAWALRTLYDDNYEDGEFVAMVEEVFRQTAAESTRLRFLSLIEDKKREGKREEQVGGQGRAERTSSASESTTTWADEAEESEGAKRGAKRVKTTHVATAAKALAGKGSVVVRTGQSGGTAGHRRHDSASSMSSLSSAMSLASPSASPRQGAGSSSGSAAPAGHGAGKRQPIKTRGRAKQAGPGGLSVHAPHSDSKEPKSPTMAGRVAAAADQELPSKKQTPLPECDDEASAVWERRRAARSLTNALVARPSLVRADETRRTTRSASKRPSPAAFACPAAQSRAATPTRSTAAALRPAKRARTGLRTKTSPVKKKGGTAAGLPRAMAEATTGQATRDALCDNDEYCSACGNAGDVVCCDGCPRSFHFECVDMAPSNHLPDEWFCTECLVRRFPLRVPVHKGLFGSALNLLEKSNPRAFSLPPKLQTYFEGVRAGAHGDYEDTASSKPAPRKRNGYDELPDLYKQREDGRPVLCHACQKPAAQARAMMPCSMCPLFWHLDCLQPPLAIPPPLKSWRCPAHAHHLLLHAPPLAPAHRFRNIKASQPITPALSRGLKNNGHIEIEWAEPADAPDKSAWPDAQSFGRTYKLQAKPLVLDFIEQLRLRGAGYASQPHEPRPMAPLSQDSQPLRGSALQRTLDEAQVSLTLAALRQSPSHKIDLLLSALVSAADPALLALMAKGSAHNMALGQLTDLDRQSLRAMLAQMDAMSSRIRHVLGHDDKPLTAPLPSLETNARTPISEPPSANEPPEKLDAMDDALAEPTPPSTVDHADEGSMDLD
ncbi:hypothetical protein CDD81_4265 [Ophiocordyceps australis]|uniref:PHD-type domain-containing protein n=1 Tax=Ophiocordyceps australis TaxID=1399860 RepID=A0A2C5XVY1_9HYPO|nr:hypothetical protein CDD81_4265 [Ophiocordyceps australis]